MTTKAEIVKSLMALGFSKADSERASKIHKDADTAANYLLTNGTSELAEASWADTEMQQAIKASMDQTGDHEVIDLTDSQLSRAIEESLSQAREDNYLFDSDPRERKRKHKHDPVGLRNIGNTCYFNSLIQVYFSISPLREAVLNHIPAKAADGPDAAFPALPSTSSDSPSEGILAELRKLFALLLSSDQTSIDPTPFLNTVLDADGKPVRIGEQQDVTEFNTLLLAQIEAALADKSNKRQKNSTTSTPAQSPAPADTNVIQDLFFGTTATEITATRSQTPTHTTPDSSTSASFGQLIVGVSQGDLHSSIDASLHSTIESFTVSDTPEPLAAISTTYFDRLPQYLIVQLQRVHFSHGTGAFKVHERFTFPEKLSMERYLLKYRKESERLREKYHELKKTLEHRLHRLTHLTNYHNNAVAVPKLLELSAEVLSEYKIPDTHAIELLRKQANEIQAEIDGLRRQEKDLEQQIATHFSSIEKEDGVYHLKAVLVHGGAVHSGHYFAFIRRSADSIQNSRTQSSPSSAPKSPQHGGGVEPEWFKYSDETVKLVTHADMVAASLGGSGEASAYCLFYEGPKPSTKDSSTSRNSAWKSPTANASQTLPKDLQEYVDRHNQALQKRIEEWVAGQLKTEVSRRTNAIDHDFNAKISRLDSNPDYADIAYFLGQVSSPLNRNLYILEKLRQNVAPLSEAALARGVSQQDLDEQILKHLRVKHSFISPEDAQKHANSYLGKHEAFVQTLSRVKGAIVEFNSLFVNTSTVYGPVLRACVAACASYRAFLSAQLPAKVQEGNWFSALERLVWTCLNKVEEVLGKLIAESEIVVMNHKDDLQRTAAEISRLTAANPPSVQIADALSLATNAFAETMTLEPQPNKDSEALKELRSSVFQIVTGENTQIETPTDEQGTAVVDLSSFDEDVKTFETNMKRKLLIK